MTRLSPLRLSYLALSLLGGGLAIWHGPQPPLAGAPLVGLLALAVWACSETALRRTWWALSALPVAAILGLGCGLPLYLFLRLAKVDWS